MKAQQSGKKAYLAGKVTGLWWVYAALKFDFYKRLLKSEGYEVINPMEFVPPLTDWHEAMSLCFIELEKCDVLIIQPDWFMSKGCRKEIDKAYTLNIPIYTIEYKHGTTIKEFDYVNQRCLLLPSRFKC